MSEEMVGDGSDLAVPLLPTGSHIPQANRLQSNSNTAITHSVGPKKSKHADNETVQTDSAQQAVFLK